MKKVISGKKTFKEKMRDKWSSFKAAFKRFRALVSVQVRDKLDMSWTKQKRTIIRKVVFGLIKFVLIAGIIVAILSIVKVIFMISQEMLGFYKVFLVIFGFLNLLSVTFGLMKSLYYADDNKVLVTYPTSSSKLFFSKLIVYQIFEFKKALDLLLPVSTGFIVAGIMNKLLPVGIIFWQILPLTIMSIGTVFVGALLSIPALYIYKFFKKFPILELIGLILLAGGVIAGIIYVISLIPSNININQSMPVIKSGINNFVSTTSVVGYPFSYICTAIIGDKSARSTGFVLTGNSFAHFGISLGIVVALGLIVYLVIKPFYFTMMTKTFEFDKNIISVPKKNKRKNKYIAFTGKELKLCFRDVEISGSYLCVYILVPILLFFIDKIFSAMSTSYDGNMMVCAFNVLLIVLPMLASSTIVSTIYSKEGRTAYIKKTKPVKPYYPLFAKLLFNLVLSIPSIIGCAIVFANFTKGTVLNAIFLALTVIFFQYGHIFFSASLDLMNPQNEVYATEGNSINNPNERTSTIAAFVMAILISLIAYLLFNESYTLNGNFDLAFIKIAIIGLVVCVSTVLLFFLKIKAFYLDRQEVQK